MNKKTKQINKNLPAPLLYNRILAIDPSKVMYSKKLRQDLLNEIKKEQLKSLPSYKQHVRLLHQSTEGLRDLFEGEGEVLYPETPLPDISLCEHNTRTVVSDENPTTGEKRKTLRVILGLIDQLDMNIWLKEFCLLNNLPYHQRVFHVSIATLTGKPGSSCR